MYTALTNPIQTGRILVVDDNAAVARVFGLFLSQAGYDVEVIVSGRAALVSVDLSPPDLVLLDWMLPDIHGVDVCRQITSRERLGRAIPVIMMTGHNDDDHRQNGADAGASEFLGKPFTRGALLACVASVMGTAARRGSGLWRRMRRRRRCT